MECSNWEEHGLLVCSGEATDEQGRAFEQHAAVCSCCAQELELYRSEKETLFCSDVLCEVPGAHIDAKILHTCCRPWRATNVFWQFGSLAKTAGVPVLFLALGLSAGLYFNNLYNNAQLQTAQSVVPQLQKTPNSPSENTMAAVASQTNSGIDTSVHRDSLASLFDSTEQRGRQMNGQNMPGVIQVDVKR